MPDVGKISSSFFGKDRLHPGVRSHSISSALRSNGIPETIFVHPQLVNEMALGEGRRRPEAVLRSEFAYGGVASHEFSDFALIEFNDDLLFLSLVFHLSNRSLAQGFVLDAVAQGEPRPLIRSCLGGLKRQVWQGRGRGCCGIGTVPVVLKAWPSGQPLRFSSSRLLHQFCRPEIPWR